MAQDTIKIIYVEDQKTLRASLIPQLLRYNIYTIAEASNGQELLDLLPYHNPDVILLDIKMPIMDGGTVLDILTERKCNIPVIILSKYSDVALLSNFYERGAKSFLNKSMEIDYIADTILRVAKSNVAIGSIQSNKFTRREKEIMTMMCQCLSNTKIAKALNISVKTIEAHRKNIFRKTESSSIKEFLLKSFENGFRFIKWK